jgi:hypothetical protein
MKVLISLLLLSSFWFTPVFSQKWTLSHKRDTIRMSLNIGKSSDNTFTKGEGAEISGIFPKSDTVKKSWFTNSFTEIGLVSDSSRWGFGLVAEIHKNTLIEKEQDLRQYGFSISKILAKQDLITHASVYEIPISLSLKRSDDLIKEKRTFQIIGGVTFNRFTGPPILRTQTQFPKLSSGFGKIIGFSHNHNIGFAYLGADENVLLGQFDFEFNTYLFPWLSDKWINKTDLFKLQFIYKGRTPIFGETELDLNNYMSFQAGLNLAFDKKNSIELAYAWIQGADPLKGLDNQNYKTITAKIKITLK